MKKKKITTYLNRIHIYCTIGCQDGNLPGKGIIQGYKTKRINITPEIIQEELSELIEEIITNYPELKLRFGKSINQNTVSKNCNTILKFLNEKKEELEESAVSKYMKRTGKNYRIPRDQVVARIRATEEQAARGNNTTNGLVSNISHLNNINMVSDEGSQTMLQPGAKEPQIPKHANVEDTVPNNFFKINGNNNGNNNSNKNVGFQEI